MSEQLPQELLNQLSKKFISDNNLAPIRKSKSGESEKLFCAICIATRMHYLRICRRCGTDYDFINKRETV